MPASRTPAPGRAVTRSWVLAVPLTVAALTATGCGASSTPAPNGSPGSGAAVIKTAHTSLGSVLTDGKGITVYLFEKDTGTTSTCYGPCAKAWPPVLTSTKPVAAGGARSSLLGTTKRTGGKLQVTYAGHPLYYFTAGTKPGQVNGQGISGFGAHWDAVRPTGAQAG